MDTTNYQTHWHTDEISDDIATSPDTQFIFGWWDWVVRVTASENGAKRILDVACGNARDITYLSEIGCEAWGVDPSHLQLRDARAAAQESGQRLHLVRGVAEFLPFKPGVFDSLICKSALDHFVEGDRAMRGFASVLKPNGRAIVSINNMTSLSVRLSRLFYTLYRAVWPPARAKHFHWDSPVPHQHTYECTYQNTADLGKPDFDTVDEYGVSLLWGLPGWGRFLSLLPNVINRPLLRGLHGIGRRLPRMADVCVFIWQPKPVSDSAKPSTAS
ncbi:MAG: class I SAM-dependent methyltransferase [Chloroflexi bacterium]|nr:class I SAM-dependent methyltransferase [Chloroflexota bacterium]